MNYSIFEDTKILSQLTLEYLKADCSIDKLSPEQYAAKFYETYIKIENKLMKCINSEISNKECESIY